jgi:hypothetical protein
MTRALLPVLTLIWTGATLLLGELRWFRRPRLAERIRPFLATAALQPPVRSFEPTKWVEHLAPFAYLAGDRLASALGVSEPLELRLRRIHATEDPRQFRIRQIGRSFAAGAMTSLLAVLLRLPLPVIAILSAASALLTFLVIEQLLATRSARWQRRIFLELPIVSEQLGMLLSAGSSMGQALTRISRRSDAAIALDLRIVVGRLQQGVDETTALHEWAAVAGVPAVDRLLSVLALNRQAPDLGTLITEESRAARAEVHRELLELLERRAQQVWIPVTVATLVPGLLFLAVPFFEAMRLFTTT